MASISLAGNHEASVADWEKATAAVLRKAKKLSDDAPDSDVWDVLARTTIDGLTISALGTPALSYAPTGDPGSAPFTRGTHSEREGWDIRSRIIDGDNAQLLVELAGGVTSLWLSVDESVDFAQVLANVDLEIAPVVLEPTVEKIIDTFLEFTANKSLHPASNLGADHNTVDLAHITKQAMDRSILGFCIDAALINDQGGSDVQELAYALWAGVTLLRRLEEIDIDPSTAARLMEFRFAASDEQLSTIAKLRAARRLWHRVGELSGTNDFAQRQHAVTSRAMLTKYDPYVNMLRTTVAAFSAGVAGADSVTVIPFDDPLGLPESFSRRVARNTSHLLVSESHVARVVDPAGGSHVIEKLTDDMANAAWELFGQLDDAKEQSQKMLAELIASSAEKRNRLIAKREMPITGISEFPHLHEILPQRRPQPSFIRQPRRYAQAFESLRDNPIEKPVFLATLGSIAQHTARATFASNLFAAGGVDVVSAGATYDVEQLLSAYRAAHNPKTVCLASTDGIYDDWGADAIVGLREAGAEYVIAAGKPNLDVDAHMVTGFDALDFLRSTRTIMEGQS